MHRVIEVEGLSLQEMGWLGTFRALTKLVDAGASVVIERFDGYEPIADARGWWRSNAEQVVTEDHPAVVSWPDRAVFTPSVWRSKLGKVLVLEEHC